MMGTKPICASTNPRGATPLSLNRGDARGRDGRLSARAGSGSTHDDKPSNESDSLPALVWAVIFTAPVAMFLSLFTKRVTKSLAQLFHKAQRKRS